MILKPFLTLNNSHDDTLICLMVNGLAKDRQGSRSLYADRGSTFTFLQMHASGVSLHNSYDITLTHNTVTYLCTHLAVHIDRPYE